MLQMKIRRRAQCGDEGVCEARENQEKSDCVPAPSKKEASSATHAFPSLFDFLRNTGVVHNMARK